MRYYLFDDHDTLELFVVKCGTLEVAEEIAREYTNEPVYLCEVNSVYAKIHGIGLIN